MPLDIRQLRKDPSLLDSVKRSLALRSSNNHQSDEVLLATFQTCDSNARTTLQQLGALLCERNKMRRNRSNRQQQQQENGAVSAGHDLKHRLEQLERANEDAQEALQVCLEQLPNLLDEELLVSDDDEQQQLLRTSDDSLPDDDTFFCIGGFQELSASASSSSNTSLVVLTGLGHELVRTLEQTVLQFFASSLESTLMTSSPITILQLPFQLPCQLPTTTICATQQQQQSSKLVPSWMSVLESMRGQTLFDRTLPQVHLLVCQGGGEAPSPDLCTKTLSNHTQVSKKKHPHSNNNNNKNAWYNRTATRTEVQLLLLTGCSLHADSRRYQLECMQLIQTFYQQQLLGSSSINSNSTSQSFVLRIAAVPPKELEAEEASRLVLQARMPSKSSSSASFSFLELASLSNYLDYHSCDFNIRHGNAPADADTDSNSSSRNSRRCVHVLHGRLCSLEPSLEWMLQHGRRCDDDDNGVRLHLPTPTSSLGLLFQQRSFPYLKRVKRGKKGQRMIVNVVPPPPPPPSTALTTDDTKKKEGANRQLYCSNNTKNNKQAQQQQQQQQQQQPLTPDQVRLEALSCPFDFLPFYYR